MPFQLKVSWLVQFHGETQGVSGLFACMSAYPVLFWHLQDSDCHFSGSMAISSSTFDLVHLLGGSSLSLSLSPDCFNVVSPCKDISAYYSHLLCYITIGWHQGTCALALAHLKLGVYDQPLRNRF